MLIRLILTYCFIIVIAFAKAQKPQLKFDFIGTDKGMQDTYVESVIQDNYGYMWFATDNGLYRYDGIESKIYRADPQDTTSLTHNYLFNLFEDNSKHLWIGYRFGGISIYNRNKDNFSNHIFSDSSSNTGMLKNITREFYQDFDSNMWLLNAYGVARMNVTDSSWKWYSHSLDSIVFKNLSGSSITQLKDSTILIGFWDIGTIFYYDKELDGFLKYPLFKGVSNTPKWESISCMLEDSDSKLWIGTIESGLYTIDLKGNEIKQYSSSSKGIFNIPANEIKYLYEDSRQNLWVGTINGGLLLRNKTNDAFYNYNTSSDNPFSLKSNSITRIFEDNQNNLWLSSHGGVHVIDYRKNLFKYYGNSSNLKNGFNGKRVTCFYETSNGNIWIGTDGTGLYYFDRIKHTFSHFTKKDGLPDNSVVDIEPNDDGKLWLATWGGLVLFDPVKISFTPYNGTPKNGLNMLNLKGIHKNNDLLWIATNGKGINIYDTKSKIFYNRESAQSGFNFDMNIPTWGNDIYSDKNGNIWIITNVGLYRYNGKKLIKYLHSPKDKNTISSNNVNAFFEDSKGGIWIGSTGLDMYNPLNDSFIRMNDIIHELPQSVRSITEDVDENLWLGSKGGLYKLSLQDSSVVGFTSSDGLSGTQFVDRSILTTAKHDIFIGGYDGFNTFQPHEIHEDTVTPKVYINSLLIWSNTNNTSQKPENVIHNKNIILEYKDSRTIYFEYIGINLHASDNVRYQHMLENFDNTWKSVGEERRATFTNLKPGTYIFKVKAGNKAGFWNDDYASVKFEIKSPWWLTWWFKAIIIITVALLVYLYIYIREKNIKKNNLMLQQMVSERTHELEETNIHLEDQKREVQNQYNKLKQNQEVIRIRNQELNETMQMKDKLLSIIAHDLKNPLNSIIGFSQLLKDVMSKGGAKEKLKSYTDVISTSSIKLNNQLNNLLDWARSQSNNIKYSPVNSNVAMLVKDVISLLSDSAYSKQISINAGFETHYYAYADTRMISTVIRNLISNSIKFTPRGGQILITLSEDVNNILLSVKDTGVGMSEDQIEGLFFEDKNTTTPGTEDEKGTGLGLKISKEFIEINKGDIFVSSTPGEGTLFTVMLPKGEVIGDEISTKEKEKSTYFQEPKTLLVVDDNYEIVEYVTDIFSNEYTIEAAYNGKEGFAKAVEIIPDLIISDVKMPEMDGRELCMELKKSQVTSHIPFIFVTAEEDVDKEILSFEVGANDYILKPFNKNVLKLKVNALLENREKYRNYLKKEVISTPLKEIKTESKDESLLSKVNDIVEKHMKTPDLSVEFLAREIGVSRTQLFRKFKAILGYSPVEYIRMYRLQRAAQMLKTGKYRISEVAYDVGFSDPKYFSTCFSKQYGQTPSEFLKEL